MCAVFEQILKEASYSRTATYLQSRKASKKAEQDQLGNARKRKAEIKSEVLL